MVQRLRLGLSYPYEWLSGCVWRFRTPTNGLAVAFGGFVSLQRVPRWCLAVSYPFNLIMLRTNKYAFWHCDKGGFGSTARTGEAIPLRDQLMDFLLRWNDKNTASLMTLLALQRGNVGLKVTENTQNHLDFTSQKKRIRNPLEIYSNTLTIIT